MKFSITLFGQLIRFSNLEKSNFFPADLENKITSYSYILNKEHLSFVEFFSTKFLLFSLPTQHTSLNKMQYKIQKHYNNKAPGYDPIIIQIIRLPKKFIMIFTHIFSSILHLSHTPLSWKYIIIILIYGAR